MPEENKPSEDCACHEPHISPRIKHTKEKCYVIDLPQQPSQEWRKELKIFWRENKKKTVLHGKELARLEEFICQQIQAAESRGSERGHKQAQTTFQFLGKVGKELEYRNEARQQALEEVEKAFYKLPEHITWQDAQQKIIAILSLLQETKPPEK